MAGFGTNRRIPGSENTPVHGAVDRARQSFDEHAGNLGKTVSDTGNALSQVPGGIQSGLQGAGHSLFGSQTAIGGAFSGLFGGGSESQVAAPVAQPSRPAMGATSVAQVSSPTATARPLNISASSSGATAGRKAGKANKRKKSKGK